MPQTTTNLGKVLIVPKGDHNPNTLYERLDTVQSNGSTFICLQGTTVGIPITNTAYWSPFAKSAYQNWLDAGNAGTYQDFLTWLQVPAEEERQAAEEARDLSQAWASNPENQPVFGSLYSSRHYMEKALDAQSAAEQAKTSAETAWDNFDDTYLGAKASDPAVDNDGNALKVGAMYFNSVSKIFKVWDGSAWITHPALESARSQSTTKAPNSKLLDDELNKLNISLIPGTIALVKKPDVNTTTNILNLGDDPILVINNKTYALKVLWPSNPEKYTSISLSPSVAGSTRKLLFNTSTKEFRCAAYYEALTQYETVIGTGRVTTGGLHDWNFPFQFTYNGNDVDSKLQSLSFENLNSTLRSAEKKKVDFESIEIGVGSISFNGVNDDANTERMRTANILFVNGGYALDYNIASGFRIGIHSYSVDENKLLTHRNDSGWKTGVGTHTISANANCFRIVFSKFSGAETEITKEEIYANVYISGFVNMPMSQLYNQKPSNDIESHILSVEQYAEGIAHEIKSELAVFEGALKASDIVEASESQQNVTFNSTLNQFFIQANRVTFLGIPIANYKPKVKLTVAAGYKAGVLFFADTNYSALLKGFTWTEGSSEWTYDSYDANIVTVGISKVGDANISIAEAIAAITSFEYTPRDVIVNKKVIDHYYKLIDVYPLSDKTYTGEKIDLNQKQYFNFENLFDLKSIIAPASIGNNSIQGTAIYGNFLVQGYHTGYLGIINLTDNSLVSIISLPEMGATMHANNLNFSNYWIVGNSDFPLLYVSESQGSHRCFVYSLTTVGATLVQTISFTGTGYELSGYVDWCINNESGFIYSFGNNTANGADPSNRILIKKFVLPAPESGNVTFADIDVIESFFNDEIYIFQGQIILNDKMFCPYGFNNPNGIVVIDLIKKRTVSVVDLSSYYSDEPEGISVYDNGLIISYQSGMVRKFTF